MATKSKLSSAPRAKSSKKTDTKSKKKTDSKSKTSSGTKKMKLGKESEPQTQSLSMSSVSMSDSGDSKSSALTLSQISKKMRHLDLCMMTTIGEDGMTASRPMSNNGDVEYDGNSYFFTSGDSKLVQDLKKNSSVNLSFSGKKNLFISVSGQAKLVRSKKEMKEHWVPDLEKWFEEGLDTPDLVMVAVEAKSVHLWKNELEQMVEFN